MGWGGSPWLCLGGSAGWVCPAERGSPVQVPTLGLSTLAGETLGRHHQERCDPLLPFPGASEGDKKAEKSPTDDKVPLIPALHPKTVGRACGISLLGSSGLSAAPGTANPTVPPEQEAAARGVPAVPLLRGTLSLQSPGEGRPGLPVSSQPCPGLLLEAFGVWLDAVPWISQG